MAMEIVGSNGYDTVPNETKHWRLIMNFMSSSGIGNKNSSDTKNEVYGQIYSDLACYLLSDGGVGPREIVLWPANSDPPTLIFSLHVIRTI